MLYRVIDNPEGCTNPDLRGDRTCSQCFWAHVNERNQWTGSDLCWEAACLTSEKIDKTEKEV